MLTTVVLVNCLHLMTTTGECVTVRSVCTAGANLSDIGITNE